MVQKDKQCGYIIGADDVTYYFSNLDCIDINETFEEGDNVLFIPMFGEMDSASKVEKVSLDE